MKTWHVILPKLLGKSDTFTIQPVTALSWTVSPPQPAFSESGPSKSTPGPGGLHMWEPVSRSADFLPTKEDPSPLVKASCSLRSDAEAPTCTAVTESSWMLRILQRVTFISNYLDPYVYQGYETVGRKYFYAPPSEISGYVDEGFPSCTQIHLDKEVSSLESEELSKTARCTAAVSKRTKQ